MYVFQDLLETLQRRLAGRVRAHGRALPVFVEWPDPDIVGDQRPLVAIQWYDLTRALAEEAKAPIVAVDEMARTATLEQPPLRFWMWLQFDVYTLSNLDDAEAYAALIEQLEQMAAARIVTDTLQSPTDWRFVGYFRDHEGRNFHSAVRYRVRVDFRRAWLAETVPLVEHVIVRYYRGMMDRLLEAVGVPLPYRADLAGHVTVAQ